jgi:ABC-type multidrug transport system ATPase subunit
LLTDPQVLFLDEPTSGLDPATRAGLLANLRELADPGATVVLTTHAVQDLSACDRVLFLARGGRLAFAGSVDDAFDYFGVTTVEAIYVLLARRIAAGRTVVDAPNNLICVRERTASRPGKQRSLRAWRISEHHHKSRNGRPAAGSTRAFIYRLRIP